MKLGLATTLIWLAAYVHLVAQGDAAKPANDSAPAIQGSPKIHFDKTVFDFGKTSQVEQVAGTFTVQNVGDGVLKLDRPTTSCGCTVAAVKPEVLKPGEKGELSFTLNMPKGRAILQKEITVTSNDPQTPRAVLTVKADYTPLYDVNPSILNVTQLRKGETTNLTVHITRTDGAKFTIARVAPSQTNSTSWLQAKAEKDPNSPSDALIQVTIKAEGGPKYYGDAVNIYVEGSDQPAAKFSVTARSVGDIVLSRDMIFWPISDASKVVAAQSLTAKALVDGKFEIKNLSSSLKEVAVEATPKDDKTVELVAKLTSIPNMTTNGVIHFETNVPSEPRMDVPVSIFIFKAAPANVPKAKP